MMLHTVEAEERNDAESVGSIGPGVLYHFSYSPAAWDDRFRARR